MKSIIAILCLGLLSVTSFSHDDLLGQFRGDKLGLFYRDHTFSGHINGQLVYATPLEDGFGLKLTQRIQGRDFVSELKKTDGGMVGQLFRFSNEDKAIMPVLFKLDSVNPKEGAMAGSIDGVRFTAQIRSQSMQGNHYVDPEFEVSLNQVTYRFQLENGMTCMGCATKVVYVVLGVLKSTGAL